MLPSLKPSFRCEFETALYWEGLGCLFFLVLHLIISVLLFGLLIASNTLGIASLLTTPLLIATSFHISAKYLSATLPTLILGVSTAGFYIWPFFGPESLTTPAVIDFFLTTQVIPVSEIILGISFVSALGLALFSFQDESALTFTKTRYCHQDWFVTYLVPEQAIVLLNPNSGIILPIKRGKKRKELRTWTAAVEGACSPVSNRSCYFSFNLSSQLLLPR